MAFSLGNVLNDAVDILNRVGEEAINAGNEQLQSELFDTGLNVANRTGLTQTVIDNSANKALNFILIGLAVVAVFFLITK